MIPRFVERPDRSVELRVQVQPRAARSEVYGFRGDALLLRLDAPPVDGVANEAVRRLLADFFGVPPCRVRIVHGQRSRRKLLRLSGVDADALRTRLARLASHS